MRVDCGPIPDQALCEQAVVTALLAQLNAPPASAVTLRLPRPDDDCKARVQPCDAGAVIAVIQSGDTLQDVALQRTVDGWVLFEQIR